ncbi:MAG: SgcJ/EcaC family oxidoreductase [Vicinamibacterales bacterium]
MGKLMVLATAVMIAASAQPAQAGEQQASDEAAVRQLSQKYQSAWNARNTQQILRLYTDDALVIQPTGEMLEGRAAIEAGYAKGFANMGDARLSLEVETIRFVGANTAVFTGTSSMTGGLHGPGSHSGHFMVVARKVGGEWKASEVHAAMVVPESGSEAAGTTGLSEAAAEAEVKELGERWMKAMMDRDPATLEEIYADDYTFVDPTGKLMSREDDINDVRSGKLKFESHDQSNVRTRVYGDTAVVTGISNVKGTYEGEDISGRYRWTDTYVRQNGEWRVAASQVTRIAEEPHQKK